MAKENLLAARTLACKVLDDPAVRRYQKAWFRAAEVVTAVNSVLINSDAPAPEKVAYIVQQGDNLVRIATRQRTSVGAIQRFNSMDPANPTIYPGNVLYILKCDWSVLVSKSHFCLLLFDGERL